MKTFVVLIFLTPFKFLSQDCFKNCPTRLSMSIDSLRNSTRVEPKLEERFRINFKILSDLKGCTFPDLPLLTISENTISIKKFSGKPVFINFWFSTCAPCLKEIPEINKLSEKYSGLVGFISISTDLKESLEKIGAYKQLNTEHVLMSRERASSEFCIIAGYPTIMILDSQGKVFDVWSGGMEPSQFYKRAEYYLDLLLKK